MGAVSKRPSPEACLWSLGILLLASGCSDYSVTPNVSCGERRVRAGERCHSVGVVSDDGRSSCASGLDDDKQGGCAVTLPQRCAGGELVLPGKRGCIEPNFQGCPTSDYYSEADLGAIEEIRYVSGDAPPGGDGTLARPFDSLESANEWLESLPANPIRDIALLLKASPTLDYRAGLTFRRPVKVLGTCAAEARLTSAADDVPVLHFAPGSDGSWVRGISLSGGAAGLSVSGARDIQVRGVWVHDVQGHGITFSDAAGESSGTVERSHVERTKDVGISSYGAAVVVSESHIHAIRPAWEAGRALGILAKPTATMVPAAGRPAALCVMASHIEDCRGAGIQAEESSVEVHGSVIQNILQPAAYQGARGVYVRAGAVRPWPATPLPADCAATDHGFIQNGRRGLLLQGSVIQHVGDIGLSLANSDAVVDHSVIREIGGSEGPASGLGIRARSDLAPSRDPELRVTHSVVGETERGAIHVEGQRLIVEDSIIRNAGCAGCAESSAPGISAYPSIGTPSRVDVQRTWVSGRDGVSRAALAMAGSSLSLSSVVLECGAPNLTAGPGSDVPASGFSCECLGRQRACGGVVQNAGVTPGSANACAPDAASACFQAEMSEPSSIAGPLPNVTVWSYDHEELGSQISGQDGLVSLQGLPLNTPSIAAARTDVLLGLAMIAPFDRSTRPIPRFPMPGARDQRWDVLNARKGAQVLVRVCSMDEQPTVRCRGVVGVTASLSPGPFSLVVYFNAGDGPDTSLPHAEGPSIVFLNVEPGEHIVRLQPPAGQRLSCRVGHGGVGWPTDEPNAYKVYVEESAASFVADLICSTR